MDSFRPAHGPARDLAPDGPADLDDVLAGLGATGDDTEDDTLDDGRPPELPELVEAVTGRARDLHRLADRLSADAAAEDGAGTLSAVALLRAHAGAVDDLAEHLLAAGSDGEPPEHDADTPIDVPTEPGAPGPPGPSGRPPRGVPRSAG